MSRQLVNLANRIERSTYELESIHGATRQQWQLEGKLEPVLSMIQIAHDALETALNLINPDSQPQPQRLPSRIRNCAKGDGAGGSCILEHCHSGECQMIPF